MFLLGRNGFYVDGGVLIKKSFGKNSAKIIIYAVHNIFKIDKAHPS